MPEPEENETSEPEEEHLRDGLTGLGQKILGQVETIGGILTGDPTTQAEGEFNVEVGDLREEIEEDLDEAEDHHRDAESQSKPE
jgi:uncharacterized protein YjbJ (UPF0337 family)